MTIDISKMKALTAKLRDEYEARISITSSRYRDAVSKVPLQAATAIESLLSELEAREADRRDNPRLWSRKDVQKKAIEYGFEYWRAPDSHGVECTTPQAVDFLQDLLGVEVEIKDVAIAQRQEGEEK